MIFKSTFNTLTAAALLSAANAQGQYDLAASTWIGGDGTEEVIAIEVDSEGNVYVAGSTSSQNVINSVGSLGGYIDGFVAKLSPDLSELYWFTYIGGSDSSPITENEWATDVVPDGMGGAIVVGKTRCHDFPTVNALDDTLDGPSDAFVTRVDSNGEIVFSTYLGGNFEEMADDRGGGQFVGEIELTSDNVIVIAGDTRSEDFPAVNAIDGQYGADEPWSTFHSDVFVTRMSFDGQQILSSTFIGDGYRDEVWDMRLDADDQPVLVGQAGPEWPLTPGAFSIPPFTSSGVVYITKLLEDCSDYAWSAKMDRVSSTGGHLHFNDVANAPDGTVYAAGYSTSGGFPVPPNAYQPDYADGNAIQEGYVIGLSEDGSTHVSGTWVGTSVVSDTVEAISVDPEGNVILARNVRTRTGSTSNPGPTYIYAYNGEMTTRESVIDYQGQTSISVATPVDIRTTASGDVVSCIYSGNLITTPGSAIPDYPGGGSPLITLWAQPPLECLADTNGDGALTPADFTAWIDAFNNDLPACDQNADGSCDPADFSAWINNFNAGCV